MKYQQKPAIIDAVQWTGNNLEEMTTLAGAECSTGEASPTPGGDPVPGCLFVPTSMGSTIIVLPDYWVTKDANGNTGYTDDATFKRQWQEATP